MGGERVDATTLTMRIPVARTVRANRATTYGLAFDALGGPLVAVCGLTGGAGTTSLALLLANGAARESTTPVLLTEADPARAGLAALTGHATPRSLGALAAHLHDKEAPRDTFAELPTGLRLIAAAAQPAPSVEHEEVATLLTEARAAHGLVIVDCGTSWTADSPALTNASHIIWTTPATASAATRAARALDAVAPPPGRACEALAVTRLTPARAVSVRSLRRIARARCEQLVLIDHDDALARGEQPHGTAHGQALTSLGGLLRRQP
jgi:MinD-like ATPase involved in chromosome partitioning or flagellar assembly